MPNITIDKKLPQIDAFFRYRKHICGIINGVETAVELAAILPDATIVCKKGIRYQLGTPATLEQRDSWRLLP